MHVDERAWWEDVSDHVLPHVTGEPQRLRRGRSISQKPHDPEHRPFLPYSKQPHPRDQSVKMVSAWKAAGLTYVPAPCPLLPDPSQPFNR